MIKEVKSEVIEIGGKQKIRVGIQGADRDGIWDAGVDVVDVPQHVIAKSCNFGHVELALDLHSDDPAASLVAIRIELEKQGVEVNRNAFGWAVANAIAKAREEGATDGYEEATRKGNEAFEDERAAHEETTRRLVCANASLQAVAIRTKKQGITPEPRGYGSAVEWAISKANQDGYEEARRESQATIDNLNDENRRLRLQLERYEAEARRVREELEPCNPPKDAGELLEDLAYWARASLQMVANDNADGPTWPGDDGSRREAAESMRLRRVMLDVADALEHAGCKFDAMLCAITLRREAGGK